MQITLNCSAGQFHPHESPTPSYPKKLYIFLEGKESNVVFSLFLMHISLLDDTESEYSHRGNLVQVYNSIFVGTYRCKFAEVTPVFDYGVKLLVVVGRPSAPHAQHSPNAPLPPVPLLEPSSHTK